jgi:hypothetical protein
VTTSPRDHRHRFRAHSAARSVSFLMPECRASNLSVRRTSEDTKRFAEVQNGVMQPSSKTMPIVIALLPRLRLPFKKGVSS